jgi:hypothetical protein
MGLKGIKFLLLGCELLVFLKQNQQCPQGVKNMHVLRGFSVLSFIETIQMRNYTWISRETKLYVGVFSSFLYGFIVNIIWGCQIQVPGSKIMLGCQTQTHESDVFTKLTCRGAARDCRTQDFWV